MQNPKRYEALLVGLMFLTWGAVFLDRMSLLYLSPFIVHDLHLSRQQVGLLASALALAWAFSSLLLGAASDRIGRRPILVPAVFISPRLRAIPRPSPDWCWARAARASFCGA